MSSFVLRPRVEAGRLRQQEAEIVGAASHAALPVLQRAGGDAVACRKSRLRQAGMLADVADCQVGGVPYT